MESESKDIGLMEVIKTILRYKSIIFKTSLIFFVFGIIIAIFSPEEYTAEAIIMPETQKTNVNGSFSSLAAMAGIDLNSSADDIIPITIYPKILSSIPFKKKLIQTKLRINGVPKDITYKKFYTEKTSLLGSIFKKDKIINKIDSSLNYVTRKEFSLFKRLEKQIKLEIDEKSELISLGVSMPDPLASAQMTEAAINHLQSIITEIKIKKATDNLKFIKKSHKESKQNFETIDSKLAKFKDSNRGLITSESRRVLSKLENEYSLSFQIYSELSKKLETQKIKVEETTPVFSIIEPVVVPLEKSKPKRFLIVTLFTFLGFVFGAVYILIKDVIKRRV